MADESSIWKKEIAFGRKAKAASRAAPAPEPAETSLWKKEIAFGRKAKAAPRAAQAVSEPEPAAKPSIWKKEIGLGRKREEQGVPVPERASPPERDDSVAEPLPPLAVPPLSRAVHQAAPGQGPAPSAAPAPAPAPLAADLPAAGGALPSLRAEP